MDAREFVIDQLERMLEGDAWHGPALIETLREMSPEQALARPVPAAHSTWEIVLHATSWAREVARRVRSGVARDPEDGDWPAPPAEADAATWAGALAGLRAAHEELRDAIRACPLERLHERLYDERPPEPGPGPTLLATLHGLVQHDAYHAGQIAILRRALGARP
jgi:uncharacterized damage-inducible protein DinB